MVAFHVPCNCIVIVVREHLRLGLREAPVDYTQNCVENVLIYQASLGWKEH
jgi:hypothetical protein